MTTFAAAVASRLPTGFVGSAAVALYPRFEPELRRLADFCPPGSTAVDIGGWYGPWSRRLARRCTRVVTVEPVPHLADHLRRTLPSNARVVQGAATDRAGSTVRLWFPEGDHGDRGVSSLERRDIHAHCVEVESLTIDSLDLHGVGFVKMDVDGAEVAALRGAAELLRRDRPALLVELESRLGPIAPAVDLLTGQGYAGWVLAGRRWIPLAGFDLPAHQARTEHLVHQGLLRRAFVPQRTRYINSVLFLPEGRVPGTTAA